MIGTPESMSLTWMRTPFSRCAETDDGAAAIVSPRTAVATPMTML